MFNVVEISKEILKLQKMCSKYVTVQKIEEIKKYLEKEYYIFTKVNDKIVSLIYRVPIGNNGNHIYRVGGLSVLKDKNNIFKKELKETLKKSFSDNLNLIAKTDNYTIGKWLKELGAIEISYNDLFNKYPIFIKSYLNNSKKEKKYYEDKLFYIKIKK